MVREYTERYKGFQIRDVTYLGEPPTDTPPTFDVVKWKSYDTPIEARDLLDNKIKTFKEYCYSVGYLEYNVNELCFEFKSVGLRWLEAHPDEDVENWIIKWCDYKSQEMY
jgi:hypothetical protein